MEKIIFATEKEFLAIAHGYNSEFMEYKEEKLSNFDTEKGFVDVTFYVERISDNKKFKGTYTRGGQGNNWCDSMILEEIIQKPKIEKEPTITITKKEYDELVKDSMMLSALEGAGVDNWEGYDDAMEILEEMKNEE